VAIDVDTEVNTKAGRIPSPDRIFSTVQHQARARTDGKIFSTLNDGFLRKVRVAQYQRGLTRRGAGGDEVAGLLGLPTAEPVSPDQSISTARKADQPDRCKRSVVW